MTKNTLHSAFRRNLSSGRLARLNDVAARPGWWRELLAAWRPSGHGEGYRLAVRGNYLNFYLAGQSVARIGFGRGDAPHAEVHHKYLGQDRAARSPYVRLGADAAFDLQAASARIAAAHLTAEKTGLERFVAANGGILDLEMALPAEGDRTSALRIDLVLIEERPDGQLQLAFWEAKRISDKRLRRREGDAEVVGQGAAYARFLEANAEAVIAAYRETAKVLLALHDMASAHGLTPPPLDALIVRFAHEATASLDPRPRLLIIDDGAARDASAWNHHLAKLHAAGLLVHVAAPGDDRLPTGAELAAMPAPAIEPQPRVQSGFARAERRRQTAWRAARGEGEGVLMPDWPSNIDNAHRETAQALFAADPPIQAHRWVNHLLSSQAACVNFLMPMLGRPDLLARWVGHVLGIEGVTIEPIEERAGVPQPIAFEWFPNRDYLNEAGPKGRTRGANATSLDAAVRYRHDGQSRLLLIEWKYTESYGAELGGSHDTRTARYANIWRWPAGPIRADPNLELTDFYREPFYQLLRQQMLAHAIEVDPKSGFTRVDLVHISPAGNKALRAITAPKFEPFGGAKADAFTAFKTLLAPAVADRFRSLSTAEAFAPVSDDKAFAFVRDRYAPLLTR